MYDIDIVAMFIVMFITMLMALIELIHRMSDISTEPPVYTLCSPYYDAHSVVPYYFSNLSFEALLFLFIRSPYLSLLLPLILFYSPTHSSTPIFSNLLLNSSSHSLLTERGVLLRRHQSWPISLSSLSISWKRNSPLHPRQLGCQPYRPKRTRHQTQMEPHPPRE